jgi:putative RNA 2'-phosphotransferase
VDLQLKAKEPPHVLYHGTVDRFLASIMAEGLKKGKRHHVHLSKDTETARKVGARRGNQLGFNLSGDKAEREGTKKRLSDARHK